MEKQSRMHLSMRSLLIGVAGIAVIFATTKHVVNILVDLPFMPHVSHLSIGQRVVIIGEIQSGDSVIPADTQCIVISESAWDDDSCYPGRDITVRLCEGQYNGSIMIIARDYLRASRRATSPQ